MTCSECQVFHILRSDPFGLEAQTRQTLREAEGYSYRDTRHPRCVGTMALRRPLQGQERTPVGGYTYLRNRCIRHLRPASRRWGPEVMADIREALTLGRKFHQTGELHQAERIYRQILQTMPDHIEALCLLGAACHGLGRLDEALAVYEHALRLQPDF